MPSGPILIFDKSTIQALTLDESVLLDNFFMSNIVPVFFAECLADLERDMSQSKGTPESLVGSLATKTPESQACGNVFHMRVLQSELHGSFDLSQVLYRPLRESGRPVTTGDMKGVVFRASEEEEAVNRWQKREFLDLERQQAKNWRGMIENIDLDALAVNIRRLIGPWREPKSLEDAKFLTDTIIDCVDQEWLLRSGLMIVGLPEETENVVKRWTADRRKPLRGYLPYFVHILSINIFFALVLRTNLLKRVKPSHQIDLSYLYYLPFCMVFTSRDNFHVQVAPLFITSAQSFVHGDDLKEDLRRLDERYHQLPQKEQDRGLLGFAPYPPIDGSFLTTRLWDKHLPDWRQKAFAALEPLPKELIEAIEQLGKNVVDATPAGAADDDIDKADFVTITKRVWAKKGSYLRFPKEKILKIAEEEERKTREDLKGTMSRIYPAGTLLPEILAKLAELSSDPKCRYIEAIFLMGKVDQQGDKIIDGGMWSAEIRPIGINIFNEDTERFLKEQFGKAILLGALILWFRYGVGKLGTARFRPVQDESGAQAIDPENFEEWEGRAIADYMRRRDI
jgi:hypothetical protein